MLKLIAVLVVAFFEGISSLGIEIYALRLTNLFVGASIAITGIILGFVLLACALGYYYGGKRSVNLDEKQLLVLAAKFFMATSIIYLFNFCMQRAILAFLVEQEFKSIPIASIVGLMYGIGVFFGCSAIPILAEYLALRSGKNNITGKYAGLMVAVTTLGSVIGSTMMPIFAIPLLGLEYALVLVLLLVLSASQILFILAKQYYKTWINLVLVLIIFGYLKSPFKLVELHSTAFNDWYFKEYKLKDGRIARSMQSNINYSQSCFWVKSRTNCNEYIDSVNEMVKGKKHIVTIGGAGMVQPYLFAKQNKDSKVDVVEIDSEAKRIAEIYLLEDKLPSNVQVHEMDGRYFLRMNESLHTDAIFIDAFEKDIVATSLFTVEALDEMKKKSSIVFANVILKNNKDYSKIILNTWRYVFPNAYILKISDHDIYNAVLCSSYCRGGMPLKDEESIKQETRLHTDNIPILEYYALLL